MRKISDEERRMRQANGACWLGMAFVLIVCIFILGRDTQAGAAALLAVSLAFACGNYFAGSGRAGMDDEINKLRRRRKK